MRGSGAQFLPANISMVSEIDKLFCVFYPRNPASLRKYKQTWSVYDTDITFFSPRTSVRRPRPSSLFPCILALTYYITSRSIDAFKSP